MVVLLVSSADGIVCARFRKGSRSMPRLQILNCSGPKVFVVNLLEPGVSKKNGGFRIVSFKTASVSLRLLFLFLIATALMETMLSCPFLIDQ